MAARRPLLRYALALVATLTLPRSAAVVERRDEVSFLRDPYNKAFYDRHNQFYCSAHRTLACRLID